MDYPIYFSVGGAPKPDLTPSIVTYVRMADGVAIEPVPEMVHLAGGGYKFSADPLVDTYVEVDGGSELADEDRYKALRITPQDGALDAPVSALPTRSEMPAALLQAIWGRWEYDRATGAFSAYDAAGQLQVSGTIIASSSGVVRNLHG